MTVGDARGSSGRRSGDGRCGRGARPGGAGADGVGTPALVGRESELLRVAAALSSPPALVLIEGEAGIGKSRLVRESLGRSAAEGPRHLVAMCPPFREALTLGPVVDAVRQAVADPAALGLSGELHRRRAPSRAEVTG
ncbi:AAA family ATPase [Actinacidiphila polyblastidii]|uniref:AAA family ATPase n=1 Tax=Actinacidiphila polyblastidii TaxID=3110430 RepID=UPI0039BC6EF3